MAVRWLRKNPLFAAAVVFILALGIGANSAVFSIVDAVLLRPSPFPQAERLVRVEERTNNPWTGVPVRDYQRWAGRTDIFERTAAYLRDTVTLTGDGEPEQVIAVRTWGLFPVLGVHAQSGRSLIASDDEGGAQHVAVISDRLWRRRYHADPGVIGRGITISDEAYTVVGVMSPEFELRYPEAELWAPLRLTATTPWVQVIGRLRPGVSVAQSRSALEIVAHQMEQEEPKDRAGLKILVTQWRDTPDKKYEVNSTLRAGGGRFDDVDRVRRCGRSTFDPRGRAAEGDYDSDIVGRWAMANCPATVIRKPGSGDLWECGRYHDGPFAAAASDEGISGVADRAPALAAGGDLMDECRSSTRCFACSSRSYAVSPPFGLRREPTRRRY